MRVHKGDTVLVISGKDKGAKGKVLEAYPTRDKVLVEGVNRIKKHTAVSRNERGAQSGGIVTQEAADSRVQRDGGRLRRQADAHRVPQRRRDRQEGPHRQDQRQGHLRMTTAETTEKTLPRLKQRYREEIREALQKEFGFDNVMQIPGVVKVVVNMGVGDAARDAKLINGAVNDLALITGQKPEVRKATKSIAQFKLREGMPIGARVTLRGDRMWEFLDRLISISLPRIRDFRGLGPKQFDGRGNYTFGLTEQSVFHEIDVDSIDRPRGMDITVVTTATNDDEGRALLRALGFPFKEN